MVVQFLKRIMELFGGNINAKAFNKGNSPEIVGDGNKMNNLTNSTFINGNVKVYIDDQGWNMASQKHAYDFNQEADAMLKDLQRCVGKKKFVNKLCEISNYKAVRNVLSQVNDFLGDPERRELLRNMVLEKFKTEGDEGRIYLEAIVAMEKLKPRDLRVLAAMAFVMTLSRSLGKGSVILHKRSILALLEYVGELEEAELEMLRVNGMLYPLFPKEFDIAGLERLKDVDVQIYENCIQWVKRNGFVCAFKLTPLGNLLAKNVFSVIYDLNYESAYNYVLPLKYTDLNVGNISADGDVIASGTMAMGKQI